VTLKTTPETQFRAQTWGGEGIFTQQAIAKPSSGRGDRPAGQGDFVFSGISFWAELANYFSSEGDSTVESARDNATRMILLCPFSFVDACRDFKGFYSIVFIQPVCALSNRLQPGRLKSLCYRSRWSTYDLRHPCRLCAAMNSVSVGSPPTCRRRGSNANNSANWIPGSGLPSFSG
jgi:hypothetical protein